MMSWECVVSVWDWVGRVFTIPVALAAIYALYLSFFGVLPVLLRLGNLRRRKIAIFAKGDASASLVSLFEDAKLFKRKNIIPILSAADFGRADPATIYVVHWPDWPDDFANIVQRKSDQTALVVFAPQGQGLLTPEAILLLERERNVVLANFRGRLLNDVVSSFITTAYEKR